MAENNAGCITTKLTRESVRIMTEEEWREHQYDFMVDTQAHLSKVDNKLVWYRLFVGIPWALLGGGLVVLIKFAGGL